jgi:hypothetical protein
MGRQNWNADYIDQIVSTGRKVVMLDQIVITPGRTIVVVDWIVVTTLVPCCMIPE